MITNSRYQKMKRKRSDDESSRQRNIQIDGMDNSEAADDNDEEKNELDGEIVQSSLLNRDCNPSSSSNSACDESTSSSSSEQSVIDLVDSDESEHDGSSGSEDSDDVVIVRSYGIRMNNEHGFECPTCGGIVYTDGICPCGNASI